MKIILYVLSMFALSINSQGQEVELNEENGLYEYTEINNLEESPESKIKQLASKMKELNYSNITPSPSDIKGENFFSKLILGSAMEVHYNVFVQFKEDRYKITINNFKIRDERYGTMAVEELKKRSQRKWVELINEKLPEIITSLESTSDW